MSERNATHPSKGVNVGQDKEESGTPSPAMLQPTLKIKIKEHFAKRGIIAVTKSEDDRPLVFVDNLHDKTWWRVVLNDSPFENLVTPWSRTRRWSGRWWWRWSRQMRWLPENYLLKFWFLSGLMLLCFCKTVDLCNLAIILPMGWLTTSHHHSAIGGAMARHCGLPLKFSLQCGYRTKINSSTLMSEKSSCRLFGWNAPKKEENVLEETERPEWSPGIPRRTLGDNLTTEAETQVNVTPGKIESHFILIYL